MNDCHSDSDVAVIGMACRLPGADCLDQFWELLRNAGCAWGPVPESRLHRRRYFDSTPGEIGKTYSDLAALVHYEPPDPEICPLSDSAIASYDVAHVTFCEVAARACRHAGLDPARLPYANTGVYVGHAAASGAAAELAYATYIPAIARYLRQAAGFEQLADGLGDQVVQEIVEIVRRQKPHGSVDGRFFFGASLAAMLVARTFGLNGPCMSFNAACASSSRALAQAVRALQLRQTDMAIAGGASFFHSDTLVLFSQSRSVSPRGSHPFSADADGMVVGEGYVAVVLKLLGRAIADKDRILAVIPSLGLSSDGRGKSLWAPRQEGQILAIQRAYGPRVRMADLQYIEAHATSTAVGDETEVAALAAALEGQLPPDTRLPVGSAKLNVGHTLESAGLVGVIKTVLALEHEQIPPAIDGRPLNPQIDWDRVPLFVPRSEIPWPRSADGKLRRAGVDAFGIGGLNVHIVVDDYAPSPATTVPVPRLPPPSSEAPTREDDRAIAVIGMGAILPGAQTLDAFWDLLTSGRDPKTEAPKGRWDMDVVQRPGAMLPCAARSTLGGYVTDFHYDWRRHKVPPKQVSQASPLQFMILDAVDQALHQARCHERPFDRLRTGVVVGTVFGGDFAVQLALTLRLPEFQDTLSDLLRSRGVSEDLVAQLCHAFRDLLLKHMPALLDETGSFTASALASRITKSFDLMGGAVAVDSGEASSLAALGCCVDQLRSGDCDLMICVGAQQDMTPMLHMDWAMSGRLAVGPPRSPLDMRADGVVPGEGCGALLLKRLADARRDNDPILAIIRGIGAAADTVHPPASQTAVHRSLEDAGREPADVAVVETALAGQRERDAAQVHGMAEAYAQRPPGRPLLLGTSVAQLGHSGGASGMTSLLKAVVELEHLEMPPEIQFQRPAPYLSRYEAALRVPSSTSALASVRPEGPILAGVHSGGNGEVIYHVLLERGIKMKTNDEAAQPIRTPALQQKPAGDGKPIAILQFDATARRREKMRKKGSPAAGSPPAPVEKPSVQSAPVEKSLLQKTPVPAAPAQKNGNAHSATEPSPESASRPSLPLSEVVRPPAPRPKPSTPAVPSEPQARFIREPEPASRPATPATLDPQELEKFLVNFVVEHTGYPPEIVELDADLEADLGIDSIKKAQLFGELGEYFDVEPSADLSLSDFPTLRHVLDFLVKAQSGLQPAAAVAVAPEPQPQPAPESQSPLVREPEPAPRPSALDPQELEKFLVNFVVEHTGYPPEIVELDADLEADLGIDSIKKAQLFGELGEYFDVEPSADLSLSDFPTLRHVLDFLVKAQSSSQPAAVAVAPEPQPQAVSEPQAQPVREREPAPRPASPAASSSLDPQELEMFLVNFVVEHTGYPPEIVELDADLEADLGIDSIKKAQLFGELGEYFDVEPSADLSLSDFPTLRHVLDFLLQSAAVQTR